MRFLLAGLLLALSAGVAHGQVKGEVEVVGLNNSIRSDCWLPMRVRLTPQTNQAQELQIRITQSDLDGDRPQYVRNVTLTGNTEGQSPRDQRFWIYFQPQPQDGGLPARPDPVTLADLQRALQVSVYSAGGKLLAQLPITAAVTNVDRQSDQRGTKLILLVTEGGSNPLWQAYVGSRGNLEDVAMVSLSPRELPENVIGYQAVDGIVWLNAAPPDPSLPSEERQFRAIQQYVREGGDLVVCQGPQWQRTEQSFGEMLPVVVSEMADRTDLSPLRELANPPEMGHENEGILQREPWRRADNPWNPKNAPTGPFKVARAVAKPGAQVDVWIDWSHPAAPTTAATSAPASAPAPDKTPWLAREGYGLGSVTWVAQDLADPALTRTATSGWPHVWDRIFDWKNASLAPLPPNTMLPRDPYGTASVSVNLGKSLLGGMEFGSKSTGFIFIAILFFVLYWLAAGPGSYLVLAGKKKAGMSWFIFALVAAVATGVTLLIVQLLLRGSPQVRHISLVKLAPNQPAVVETRLGLYIPRDGMQVIQLQETAPGRVSYLAPFALAPKDLPATEGFKARLPYEVPVRESTADTPPQLEVTYHRSLKRLGAHWVGNLKASIEGHPKLTKPSEDQPAEIGGILSNRTGRDLRDVYLAFKAPLFPAQAGPVPFEDRIWYFPAWKNGVAIDLKQVRWDQNTKIMVGSGPGAGYPGSGAVIRDTIQDPRDPRRHEGWTGYWFGHFDGSGYTNYGVDDSAEHWRFTFPMLSLFGRLPAMQNTWSSQSGREHPRVEFLRREARNLDISSAVAAGELVVLAQAEDDRGPLPFPLTVRGAFGQDETVQGQGVTFYQAVVEMEK